MELPAAYTTLLKRLPQQLGDDFKRLRVAKQKALLVDASLEVRPYLPMCKGVATGSSDSVLQ